MSFPKIDSPCPLRFGAVPEPGRDFCVRCERRVHNLDRLSAPERRAFLASCDGPVCVAYTRAVPRALGAALAAAGVAAALGAAPARAEVPTGGGTAATTADEAPIPCPIDPEIGEEMVIMVGGVLSPGDARWEDDSETALPELPSAPPSDLLGGEELAEFVAPPPRARA